MFHVKPDQPDHRAEALGVSRETLLRLDIFAELLLRWTSKINLISARDAPLLWERHIADSLQLLPLLPPAADRAIDLGSGGGFPGLILAIASGLPFELIESDQRKSAFLREAARETAAPAIVRTERIEASTAAPAPLITARAVAPLDRLLPLAVPLLQPGGTILLLKGANAAAELTQAATQWHMQAERLPSRTDPSATILNITGIQRVRADG